MLKFNEFMESGCQGKGVMSMSERPIPARPPLQEQMRPVSKFMVPCEVVLEKDQAKNVYRFKKILLDGNDWGDWAMQSMPDLTSKEFEAIELKGGIHTHSKLEWDWM